PPTTTRFPYTTLFRSVPTGAKVLLNGTDTGATTPHTVYFNEAGGSPAAVVLELDGFVPATRTFNPTGEIQRVTLTAKTGTFVLRSEEHTSELQSLRHL